MVKGEGLWKIDKIDRHFVALERLLAKVRAGSCGAVVLIDLSHACVQSAPVAERVAYWTTQLYGKHDQVGIVVASSLLKMQMRRVASIACRDLFLSPAPALKWLLRDAAPSG